MVMGVVNLTPDSFYSGSRITDISAVLKQVEKMLEEGAAIVDIGAVSTRPGAKEIPANEEMERLIPVLENIGKTFPEAILSVDTYRKNVAEAAVHAGACIINDISGGTYDPEMFNYVAGYDIPYVLMHIQGTPETMQENPRYIDVVVEVKQFFRQQLNKLDTNYVQNKVILDPGFGFGKTVDHNFRLLKSLNTFQKLGCPVLAGISRKSMVNRIINTRPETALNGTTALHVLALLNGANILRVHDVKEAVEVVKLVAYYQAVGS
jgi:dihydropteroate synthase